MVKRFRKNQHDGNRPHSRHYEGHLLSLFADRGPIANEIAEQMPNKIADSADFQVSGR
jgi:hypothetical protein